MVQVSRKGRIILYLHRVAPQDFTAADLAKELGETTRSVAAYLKDIPEVEIKDRRRYARTESGNRYRFVGGS